MFYFGKTIPMSPMKLRGGSWVFMIMCVGLLHPAALSKPAAESFEAYSMTACSRTSENPRHDHSQILVMPDGRLLLAWSEYYVNRPSMVDLTPYDKTRTGDEAPCRISGRISNDGGRTWSSKFTLQDRTTLNVKHPNLLLLPSGDILLFYSVWVDLSKDRRIFYKRSSDLCETWSQPIQLAPTGGFYALNAGRAFIHSSGRIILPAMWGAFEGGPSDHFFAMCFYSDDDGRTWQQSDNKFDLPRRGAMEPAIAERRDGSLLTVLRTDLGELYKAVSHDRGQTWSEPETTGLPAPQASPFLTTIPKTGDLLLVWNNTKPWALTRPNSNNYHNPRNPLTAAVSKDGGKTWEHVRNIENREGFSNSTPHVAFVGDEALVTFDQCSQAWMPYSRNAEVMLKIFPIDWFYE